MEEKRIIEINGIKLEVDLRTAKTVDTYKVGDGVKILIKKYGDSFTSYPGIIAGFDNFLSRPTIVVAYLSNSYNESPLQFAFLNCDSKDIEICPMVDPYIALEKSTILDLIDKEIAKKNQEISELNQKRDYFVKNFDKFFEDATK
jgi:hypothetical protein